MTVVLILVHKNILLKTMYYFTQNSGAAAAKTGEASAL